ncbi:F-box protein At4g09920-like [Silene latifolia]|uniref:F-box protein At4g09920-like n=1 Tax=Silene latifolia TaxID=37657 RepID=UPI003D78847F
MAESKHLKSSNLIDNDNSEALDRLSDLPRNIISHILGFLSTKCAVATCVLSKKWTYAWVYVSALDFTDLPSANTDGTFDKDYLVCFKNFMNRVLLLNEAPSLERVRFVAYDCYPPFTAKEWLRTLARRSVKELYLSNKGPFIIGVPARYLLAKEELVVLKLERLYFNDLSCFIQLPCLKILSLVEMLFDSTNPEETDPFDTILYNCPILEELNIDRCTGFDELSVESSSLKTLRLVSRENRKVKVTIKTHNLESLYLSVGMKQSSVDDFPSLGDARLEVWSSTVRWVNLLQKLRFIKTLVLYRIILDGRNVVGKLPTFENLEVLEVAYSPWPIILHLTHLSIQKLMYDWPNTLPKNKALSLEEIECHCFDEVEEGISMMQFFLSNTKALRELKIHLRRWMDPKLENEVIKSLLGIPRASTQCKITIVNEDENMASDESDSEPEKPGSDDMIMISSEDDE